MLIISGHHNGFILRFPVSWLSWRNGVTVSAIEDIEQSVGLAEFSALNFVRNYIRENLASPDLDFATVAKLCRLNQRKMRRLLLSQGTTFAKLHNTARSTFAENQVRYGERSLTEIAFDCGYTKLSNFSRAFKRWHGSSPAAFRQLGAPKKGGRQKVT